MDSAPHRPDSTPPRSDAERAGQFEVLTVVVERSGGIAGMIRTWSAPVPDDGSPAARAAQRIAGLGTPDSPGAGGSSMDLQKPRNSAQVRDGFLWSLTCGEGSLRCDDEGRRRDPEVDALINEVTGSGNPS